MENIKDNAAKVKTTSGFCHELAKHDFTKVEDRMILVDAQLDADTLFDTLERAAAKANCIVIENGLNDYEIEQVILCFID